MTRLENTPKNNLRLKKEENQRKEQMWSLVWESGDPE